MVVGVFIPAIRTFEFGFGKNGLLGQEITLRALVGNHRVDELIVAIVALQNPFGHRCYLHYMRHRLAKIGEMIYSSLVRSVRLSTLPYLKTEIR
jgi:hypothetical protein